MTSIPIEWLRRQGSVEDFEREALQRKSEGCSVSFEKVEARFRDRPFGNMTDAWKEFTTEMEPQDELWFFSSPPETFSKKLGCSGYAIVRNGVIRDTLVMLRT